MLTADLVEVRRRGTDLSLRPLEPDERADALALAASYIGLVRAHVGRTRGQLAEACRLVPVAAKRRRLAAGLYKLALDACRFEEAGGLEPAVIRADLFAEATRARRALPARATFSRDAVLEVVAARHGSSPAALEDALYADLPDAQVLAEATLGAPETLVADYEAGGVQAILLRAVRVRVEIVGASAQAYRHLFRKLKFLRLLHQIEPLPAPRARAASPGYAILIDGPYSLFESVTRYGLQLALAYPAIAACGRFTLSAELRWGKDRRPLRFVKRGEPALPALPTVEGSDGAQPPEVARLLADLAALPDGPFRARPATGLVDLPGAGVIAPDVELVEVSSGRVVHVEVLGFWSRDAVWRRIELAEQGLPEPIVFAVSKHLRVSEAALPDKDDAPVAAALYVYAHKISARALMERATAVLSRSSPPAANTAGSP